jgi:hypothetical protein
MEFIVLLEIRDVFRNNSCYPIYLTGGVERTAH